MNDAEHRGSTRRLTAAAGLVAGPATCIMLVAFVDLVPGAPQVTRTAAVASLMAIWWLSEAIPLAATSLVPVALFPLLGIMDAEAVSAEYINDTVFLFVGGFMVALAMQRWNLHKRIALTVLTRFATGPRLFLWGLMATTAFLSMWISNTAAALLMVAILAAVLERLKQVLSRRVFHAMATGLLLGVAYSASIGGLATLVGTPPNMVFRRMLSIQFPSAPEVTFAGWFWFALPVSAVLLLLAWALLAWRYAFRPEHWSLDRSVFRKELYDLGALGFEEKVVLVDFLALVALWITRADLTLDGWTIPGWSNLLLDDERLGFISDGTTAMTLALLLFLVPARNVPGARILDWPTAVRIPWNVVLLFGGGFALAAGFEQSGLTEWLGHQLSALKPLSPYVLLGLICLSVTLLTELTSNTATANMLMPVVAALAIAVDINPLLLMVPVTLSCSCAFMMPVATPPNAIVFSTHRLRVVDMATSGLILNLIGVIVIVAGIYLLGGPGWQIEPGEMPAWAH